MISQTYIGCSSGLQKIIIEDFDTKKTNISESTLLLPLREKTQNFPSKFESISKVIKTHGAP